MDGDPAQTDSSSYKRGQVNSALWFAFSGARGGKVPKPFARRLSKFSELGLSPTPGSGFDLEFTLRDVIELAIALDLQDVGLNQLEIVRWLLRYREVLWAGLKEMGATALYLLIRNRTILEARGLFGSLTPADWAGATIGEPVIVKGDQQLQAQLILGGRDRKRIVIELGDLVRAVVHGLQSAPPQRRGCK
jgi:hypothetical protein